MLTVDRAFFFPSCIDPVAVFCRLETFGTLLTLPHSLVPDLARGTREFPLDRLTRGRRSFVALRDDMCCSDLVLALNGSLFFP